jgi:hypothetical protein
MDGGDRVGFQHLVDELVVGRDLGEPRVLQLGRHQVREPLTEQIRSARGTEAITRTDLTDLIRLSCNRRCGGSQWVGVRLGCAVRRLVLVPARGGGRVAGSVGVADVPVCRASWPGCGRRIGAGWWGRSASSPLPGSTTSLPGWPTTGRRRRCRGRAGTAGSPGRRRGPGHPGRRADDPALGRPRPQVRPGHRQARRPRPGRRWGRAPSGPGGCGPSRSGCPAGSHRCGRTTPTY